ncbi:hypothetical protein K7711_28295 [Nocardia sp. CA2R105]|nr:hypothetical protein [Nocardia coffeae]
MCELAQQQHPAADDPTLRLPAAAIPHDLGATRIQLLTNNPAKVRNLESGRIPAVRQAPLTVGGAPTNHRNLTTEQHHMGQLPDEREMP